MNCFTCYGLKVNLFMFVLASCLLFCPMPVVAEMALFGDYVGIGTSEPEEKLTLAAGNFLQTPGDPVHLASIVDDGSMPLNGPTDIQVCGKYAYVVSMYENALLIFDISDPSNPALVGSIEDDGTTLLDGAYAVAVAGNYAYITSIRDGGVEVIDISDPANPTHAGKIADDPSKVLASTVAIRVAGRYCYVASSSEDGIAILDISNPANPIYLCDETDGVSPLDEPSSLYVVGQYLYVTSSGSDAFVILNVSNPAGPVYVGSVVDDGSSYFADPMGCMVSGAYAYLASAGDHALQIIDISDPSNPTPLTAVRDDVNTALGGAFKVQIAGKYCYVSAVLENGVEVIDISDPSDPFHVGSIIDDDEEDSVILENAYGLFVAGKYAYVCGLNSNGDHCGIEVLGISGIDSPTASIGNLAAGSIGVSENARVGYNLTVDSSLNVGSGGIKSDGPVTIKNFLVLPRRTVITPPLNPVDGTIYYGNDGKLHLWDGLLGVWQTLSFDPLPD